MKASSYASIYDCLLKFHCFENKLNFNRVSAQVKSLSEFDKPVTQENIAGKFIALLATLP